MTVHDLFRDRMTEPNPVLDPLLEPQKLDSRKVIHLRLHVSVGRIGVRNGTLWYRDVWREGLKESGCGHRAAVGPATVLPAPPSGRRDPLEGIRRIPG